MMKVPRRLWKSTTRPRSSRLGIFAAAKSTRNIFAVFSGRLNARTAGSLFCICPVSIWASSAVSGNTCWRRFFADLDSTVTVGLLPSSLNEAVVSDLSSFARNPVDAATAYTTARSAPVVRR